MLRIILLTLTYTLLYQNTASTQENTYTRASIVMDVATSKVLHAHNADVLIYPASLTKIMTLYLTFEALVQKKLSLKQKLTVSPYAFRQIPSKIWLLPDSTITVEQAIQMLIIKSANDVSVVLAEALAGTESHFVQKMTQKARELGMKKTIFQNASGLPHPQQQSTAHDLAILSQALILHFPQYTHYVSQSQFSFLDKTYQTHNRILHHNGIYGLKTGFIRSSGYNISVAARKYGSHVVAVVIGEQTPQIRNQKTLTLLEEIFQQKKQQRHLFLSSLNPQRFIRPTLSPTQQQRYTLLQSITPQKLVRPIPTNRILFAEKEQKFLSSLTQKVQQLKQHQHILTLKKPQAKQYQNKYSFLDYPIPMNRIVFINQEQKYLALLPPVIRRTLFINQEQKLLALLSQKMLNLKQHKLILSHQNPRELENQQSPSEAPSLEPTTPETKTSESTLPEPTTKPTEPEPTNLVPTEPEPTNPVPTESEPTNPLSTKPETIPPQ